MPRRNTGPRVEWLPKRSGYYIVWYEAGKQRLRSARTTDLAEAQDALATFIRKQRRENGDGDPIAADKLTVAEVLDLYGTEHAPTTADPARIGYAIDALLPFWGEKKVSAVNVKTCAAYEKQRARAPATMRRELSTLQAALTFAVNTNELAGPAPTVTLPATPEGKERFLTHSEAARLLNAARTARGDVRLYLPLFILIGLYTGARKEAILSLRWPQVNFATGHINFKQATDDEGEDKHLRLTNKRRARQRIHPRLMTFLRYARQRGSDLGYVVNDGGNSILDIGGGWNGKEDGHVNGSFGRACKRANLPGVTPHTLRHTCGTWLAMNGTSLHSIGGYLAHNDLRTTQRYAHHHPDHQEDVIRGLHRKDTRTITRTKP